MSSDKQFTATGNDVGFQTTDNTIKTGVSVTGSVAGVVAAVPTADGTGTIARGQIATASSPAFRQHAGVYGEADQLGVIGMGIGPRATGVFGGSRDGDGFGIRGESTTGIAISGKSGSAVGVAGVSGSFQGVSGSSTSDTGVFGVSQTGRGVHGNCDAGPGVFGTSKAGAGVLGQSDAANGVLATSTRGQGVTAFSDNDTGLFAQGGRFAAVFKGCMVVGQGPRPKDPGIAPNDTNGSIVVNDGGNLFLNGGGHVFVNDGGNISLSGGSLFLQGGGDLVLEGADCAEQFEFATGQEATPGFAVVIGSDGSLNPCMVDYDTRVAGIVSGAGPYKPALVLDRRAGPGRVPVALMGKVMCRVDADRAPIEAGDLLTTSSTRGHAMKSTDPARRAGAILGKALSSCAAGKGEIPILVMLN
jgi:hypothetical protein